VRHRSRAPAPHRRSPTKLPRSPSTRHSPFTAHSPRATGTGRRGRATGTDGKFPLFSAGRKAPRSVSFFASRVTEHGSRAASHALLLLTIHHPLLTIPASGRTYAASTVRPPQNAIQPLISTIPCKLLNTLANLMLKSFMFASQHSYASNGPRRDHPLHSNHLLSPSARPIISPISTLESTLTTCPTSVDSTLLTGGPNPLESTLTKKPGGRGPFC